MNVVEPILRHCELQPNAPALCVTGLPPQIVSYGWLRGIIHNVAKHVIALGLTRDHVVVTSIRDPILHIALILALTRLGIVSVSAQNKPLPKGLRVDAALVESRLPLSGVGRVHIVDFSWLMGDGKPPKQLIGYAADDDDPCRIILTSGTTGESRAVAFTHKMVAKRISRYQTVFGNTFPSYSRIFVDLGLTTSLGYMFLIDTLARGATLFRSIDSLDNAVRAMETHRVQRWVGAPVGLTRFLKAYDKDPTRQCQLEVILSAGSRLSPSLCERARTRMCENIINVYGATETSITATAPAQTIIEMPGAAGYVTPETTVEAVDEAGNALPGGREGVLRIRGPYNASEYVGDPAASRKAFRDGWFYPGDIGSVNRDNLLVISGREKAVLNLGGNKVNPEMVENVLTSFPGIDEAGAFAMLNRHGVEEIWAMLVSRSELDELQLHLHCERHLPRHYIPRRFIRTHELPRNEMGKINRARLSESVMESSRNVSAGPRA